jgi:hypothetical protein
MVQKKKSQLLDWTVCIKNKKEERQNIFTTHRTSRGVRSDRNGISTTLVTDDAFLPWAEESFSTVISVRSVTHPSIPSEVCLARLRGECATS